MASAFVYPIEWMDISLAVAIDFGQLQDPFTPDWIHFHTIDELAQNMGTSKVEEFHIVHESLGSGSMITHSYQEYQYLLNVIKMPVAFIDERYLPKIVLSIPHDSDKDPGMMKDVFNSNYNTPNAYYRSYRLARQMEYLKRNVLRNTVSVYDMNHPREKNMTEQQHELCQVLENVHFKISLSKNE